MKILLNPNICLFKGKSKAQIINSIPKYQKLFKNIIEQFVLEVGIDKQCINTIFVLPNKTTYGTVSSIIENNKLYFNIELSDEIVPYLSHIQNTTEKFKAKYVVQHELFHCKEIKYLQENNVLFSPCPLDEKFQITNTYNFLYDEAVKLWSEFYVFYYNRQINEWHEVPDVRMDIIYTHQWLVNTKRFTENKPNKKTQLYPDVIKSLHQLWYNIVSMIAIHIQTKEDILINDYLCSNVPYMEEYFWSIYEYLKDKIATYPTWISEDGYLDFGKQLMSILKYHGLTYSTEDLLDNFVVKVIEE